MPAHPADSALYRHLFGDDETLRLFTDSAELRAMLLVEGTLARVQGELGVIPAEAGAFLHRAAQEVQIDPAALALATGQNGVPVPALVDGFRAACNAPDYAQWAHWGATSQDIQDTALALRLRPVLTVWDDRLAATLAALGRLAEAHAETPMVARTYGQAATPTSFGAVAAAWGQPLLAHRASLAQLRPELLAVSLAGAAGTLSAMGARGPEVRAALANALGLTDPGASWHSDRARIGAFAGWMAGLLASLGKIAEDLLLLTQSGIGEVSLGGGGASSTMPQKQNPVAPSVLVALARSGIGLAATLHGAGLHRQNRDGSAWFTEWLTLPALCAQTGKALAVTEGLAQSLAPVLGRMVVALDADGGLVHAEALTFLLARQMPRPEAQAAVKALCARSRASGQALAVLAGEAFPGIDWTAELAATGLGTAPQDARRFAARVGDCIAARSSAERD